MPPWTQERLARIWAGVLGRDRVDPHDDFHELGGDSLRATQILARVEAAWGVRLSLRAFFDAPSVAGLAALLGEAVEAPALPKHCPPAPAPPSLSFCEERMWFLHQLAGRSAAYSVADAFRLRGPLDVRALKRALDRIVDRHEILRTRFVMNEGEVVRHVDASLELELPVIEVPAGQPQSREAALRRLANRQASLPFDLDQPPLIRVALFRMDETDHLFAITTHHIVSDEWSKGVLMRELMTLYADDRVGRAASLPPLPLQYGDFASRQRSEQPDPELQRQLDYWKQKLGGASMVLDLPTDRPRPLQPTFSGSRERLVLDAAFGDRLQAACLRHRVTEPMLLLAAFEALLFRYTNQEDLLVGVPIANRRSADTEELIGTFVNSLVLRTDLSGDPTLAELLERVRKVALEAYDHQDAPFDRVVEALRPPRDPSRGPIFQVMFNYQTVPVAWPESAEIDLQRISLDRGAAQFDVSALARRLPGGRLRLTLEYNTDLFDRETIERMLVHYRRFVEHFVAQPQERLGAVPLLDDAERRRLVFECNDTAREYREDLCVHELFRLQAARTPDAVAVVCGDERLSYAELDARSEELAARLRGLGVGPELRVGIGLQRSANVVLGLLATLKAGGAYVPLDLDHPPERLDFVIRDAGMALLLTERSCLHRLPQFDGPIVCVDDPAGEVPTQGVPAAASPANLAYVLYTSGSTGKPKGVLIEHRALANLVHAFAESLRIQPSDRLLSVTTISFDIAGLEIFLPLLSGACVDIVARATAADGSALMQRMAAFRPTLMQATPATWQMLLEVDWPGDPGLRVLCGGEALPSQLAEALEARTASLYNVYGPTETTIWSTLQRIERGAPVSIGRPIANTRLYVLDPQGQLTPFGVRGELYIGGRGVARGYWNRPELTQERFLPDPFSGEPGARMYRTGDLVRYRRNGDLEYLGRSDHQVKVRGFRIELGEIEAVLGDHPAVLQAVVAAREDRPGDQRLVAYLVLDEDAPVPTPADLRSFASTRLPAYMTPSASVFLKALPLTPNGKIDRRALPAPVMDELRSEFVAPRDDAESRLARIWAQMLGLERVSVRDDFFEVGGSSLLAVRLCRRLEKEFARPVPLATLFRGPTVEQLAAALSSGSEAPARSAPVPMQAEGDAPPFFFVSGVHHFGTYLGREQPVYRLQIQDLERSEHLTRVEDMAASCIQSMKTIQPRGPYRIGGHCFGGVVAYEMAQQLRVRGEEVVLLALFESSARGANFLDDTSRLQRACLRIRFHAAQLARIGAGAELAHLGRALRRRSRELLWEKAWSLGLGRGLLGGSRSPKAANFQAQKSYRPHPYPGRIILFRCGERAPWRRDDLLSGWDELAGGGVTLHEVPGRHTTMYREPNVWTIVEALRGHLEQARPPSFRRGQEPDPGLPWEAWASRRAAGKASYSLRGDAQCRKAEPSSQASSG